MTRDEICSKFIESITFDLYPYQEEALLAWFELARGRDGLRPDGHGQDAHRRGGPVRGPAHRRRLYYTTPLIALTEQKFREMQAWP